MQSVASGAERSAAQRSTARTRDTCTTETQCTHMHMCRAQSCRFVSTHARTSSVPTAWRFLPVRCCGPRSFLCCAPVRWPILAVLVWCVGPRRFFVTCRCSVTLPSSGEARGAHVGVFSTDFACPQQCEAEFVRFVCDVEAGIDVECGALEANCTTDGKYAAAVLSVPSLFPSSFWPLSPVSS